MGAGGAFVGMSAARATLALIAMNAALPSNKIILNVAPETNRPKGRLPRHSSTLSHFWLSPEGHNERKTRVKGLIQPCTTAGLCRVYLGRGPKFIRPYDPFGQSTVFQNPKKLGVANRAAATPATDGHGPAFAFFKRTEGKASI